MNPRENLGKNSAVGIRGDLWASVEICGDPWGSMEIRGDLWRSVGICGDPWGCHLLCKGKNVNTNNSFMYLQKRNNDKINFIGERREQGGGRGTGKKKEISQNALSQKVNIKALVL